MNQGPDDEAQQPSSDEPRGPRELVGAFWETDRFGVSIVRELLVSVLVVLLIAAILFGVSGVWPPLVAVESDSMEPNIMTGDLVFVVEADRFAGSGAIDGTGVVPRDVASSTGYERFDRPGDVIIFAPNGDGTATPIIHRAVFWVEPGDNWYNRADPDHVANADDCEELSHCPAPHGGFITLGDNNAHYDQVQEDSGPVQPDWIIARAHRRIPILGRVRLLFEGMFGSLVPLVGGIL